REPGNVLARGGVRADDPRRRGHLEGQARKEPEQRRGRLSGWPREGADGHTMGARARDCRRRRVGGALGSQLIRSESVKTPKTDISRLAEWLRKVTEDYQDARHLVTVQLVPGSGDTYQRDQCRIPAELDQQAAE